MHRCGDHGAQVEDAGEHLPKLRAAGDGEEPGHDVHAPHVDEPFDTDLVQGGPHVGEG